MPCCMKYHDILGCVKTALGCIYIFIHYKHVYIILYTVECRCIEAQYNMIIHICAYWPIGNLIILSDHYFRTCIEISTNSYIIHASATRTLTSLYVHYNADFKKSNLDFLSYVTCNVSMLWWRLDFFNQTGSVQYFESGGNSSVFLSLRHRSRGFVSVLIKNITLQTGNSQITVR